MRILVISSVFPNPKQPTFGLFVRARVERLAREAEVRVLAPVAWFPFNRLFRGRERSGIVPQERQGTLIVEHPRFLSVPGVLKSLDGLLYFLSLVWRVRRLRREFAFDLIDAHFSYPDGMAAILLGRVLGCPVTVTLRGTIVPLSTHRLPRVQIRWTLRRAARIFSVSESLKTVAMSLGIPAEKIRVIPNGVDTEVFRPVSRSEARVALGLPPDRPLVVSVGILSQRKGHQRVLEALPAVLRRYPDLLYVIIGGPTSEGDTGPLLARLTQELGLDDHVRLVGPQPHDAIPRWLAAADLFCLATSNEGRANVVMEALACGVPVVTTRVGGNAEIVHHGENGLLVPLGDTAALRTALLTGLDRSWDRQAIAAPWQAQSWDRTSTEVLRELEAVIRPGGSSMTHSVRRAEGRR